MGCLMINLDGGMNYVRSDLICLVRDGRRSL